MSMDEPNFASYTLEELEDVLTQIDKAQFPDRVLTIKQEIARRRSGVPAENHSPLDTTNSSPHNTKKGKKSARGIVLAVWPAPVVFWPVRAQVSAQKIPKGASDMENITIGPAGGAGGNIKDATDQSFMADVIEASKEAPVLVDFWAPWCEPCKTLGPIIEKAVEEGVCKLN